jgi:hypothetical protein
MNRRKQLYTYLFSLQEGKVVVDACRDDGAFGVFEVYPNREVAVRKLSSINFESVLPDAVKSYAMKLLRGEKRDTTNILAFREPWRHNAAEVAFRLAEEYPGEGRGNGPSGARA